MIKYFAPESNKVLYSWNCGKVFDTYRVKRESRADHNTHPYIGFCFFPLVPSFCILVSLLRPRAPEHVFHGLIPEEPD